MDEQVSDQWLKQAAASFHYPPTPDVAGVVRQRLSRRVARTRRLAWAALVLVALAAALLAAPGVRAAVLEFLQIGAVRILPVDATPTSTSTVTPTEAHAAPLASMTPVVATPTRTALDLAGATTWEEAQTNADFTLRLPAYPPDLGPPDEVYRQQLWDPGVDGQVFILVWRDRETIKEDSLALYQIGLPYYGLKAASVTAIAETQVGGETAYWVGGPHRLRLASGEVEEWLLVEGNVLIWTQGEITYRLEGAPGMVEAVRVAESLEPR